MLDIFTTFAFAIEATGRKITDYLEQGMNEWTRILFSGFIIYLGITVGLILIPYIILTEKEVTYFFKRH